MTHGSRILNLVRWAERRIGTKRAAPYYYSLVFWAAAREGVSCFNYGYADLSDAAAPDAEFSEKRQFELYRQTALAIGADKFRESCLLEISSGLGGGLDYLARTFRPRLCVGLEQATPAVVSSRRRFGLIVVQGEAENLNLPDEAFDIVLNVEASHVYYGDAFLCEVARVLRPGGTFAIVDSRILTPEQAKAWLENDLRRCGLSMTSFRDVTKNIARACELDDPRREALLMRAPPPFRSVLRTFLGGVTTPNYRNFMEKRSTYFIATATKGTLSVPPPV
jgi:SAM-dependent methyltransferase